MQNVKEDAVNVEEDTVGHRLIPVVSTLGRNVDHNSVILTEVWLAKRGDANVWTPHMSTRLFTQCV